MLRVHLRHEVLQCRFRQPYVQVKRLACLLVLSQLRDASFDTAFPNLSLFQILIDFKPRFKDILSSWENLLLKYFENFIRIFIHQYEFVQNRHQDNVGL